MDEADSVLNGSEKSETTNEDSDHRRQRILINRNRLRSFYVNRIILTVFDDEKLRKTFRSDRDSINFITDIFLLLHGIPCC